MGWPEITVADMVLPPGAPEHAWHHVRSTGIGGSDALAALGLSEWTSPYELWLEKTGQLPPKPSKGRLKWGKMVEPTVVEWFTEVTGLRVQTTGTWRHKKPLARIKHDGQVRELAALCNPDRLVEDGAGLETKTIHPRSPHAKTWADEVPDYPEAQAQWYMGVTGLQRWWVAGLEDGADEPHIHEVYRDQGLIDDLFGGAAEWGAAYVLTGTAPPIDGSARTGKALDRARAIKGTDGQVELGHDLEVLVTARRKLKEQIGGAADELKAVENAIKDLLGENEYGLVNGKQVVRYYRKHRSKPYTVQPGNYMELREVKTK